MYDDEKFESLLNEYYQARRVQSQVTYAIQIGRFPETETTQLATQGAERIVREAKESIWKYFDNQIEGG